MHKLLKLLLTSLIIFSLKINFSYGAKGPADIYKVTMEKVEFCTGLERYKDDFLMTFGFQDNCSYIIKINKDKLMYIIKNILNKSIDIS